VREFGSTVGAIVGALASSTLLLTACGQRIVGSAVHTPGSEGPGPLEPTTLARCKVAASHENPLVTEWPAPEKTDLQALLQRGSVVVSYTGCSLRVLPQCAVSGAYKWQRTTTATDQLEIHDADELYAKLPVGAASLEGELSRSGGLVVRTTVSGQLQLMDADLRGAASSASCRGATHVVRSLSVGAFQMRSGNADEAGGSASALGVNTGAMKSSRSAGLLRAAGSAARCDQSTDAAPDPECASPIQMFLQPLPGAVAVEHAPPGKVKVTFLPPAGLERWDLMAGEKETVCTTPCETWIDPGRPYTLENDPGWWKRNQYFDIPDLRPYADQGPLEVSIEPRHGGELAGGIVATSLGGIAAIAGAIVAGNTCGHDPKACATGWVLMPVGLGVAGAGVWWIIDSRGAVHVDLAGAARSAD
jgi:hypothetical protein